MTEVAERTRSRIVSREAVVGIVGLGYVGLPLARVFVAGGFRVLGFDVDPRKVGRLNAGESYIKHISGEFVAGMVAAGRFEATADMRRLGEPDAVLICVPTPLTPAREPDLSYVESTARGIAAALRPGQLVVLESTTYPGTTRGVVKPILDEAGVEHFLAYSPEREDPGNAKYTAANIPKVVGGVEEVSLALATALYGAVVPEVVPVSSAEIAEACKILENTYRAVNIALVNELKVLFGRMGINVWEVIAAASTKPFGFQAFHPGPGLGGHCIPIDPFYLTWVARQFGGSTRFIELAGEINTSMPEYVVRRTMLALNAHGKAVNGSRVLVLGAAYKKDVDDPRESPSFALMEQLRELGARVSYNDPHIPELPPMRRYDLRLSSVPLTAETLAAQDAVLIATDHSAYDWEFVVRHAPLVVDPRGATESLTEHRDRIWRA